MPLIVIAEDEFLIADLLAIMLKDAGYEVAAASHGRAALALVREKRPSLVITDFMMPLMTGMELAQAMRADSDLARIPIILVSGAQGSIGRAHPEVFDAVLDKPYNETKLIETVSRLISADETRSMG
ncbi:CheY-like chemotaxis protein [Rhizobium sp. BK196]|uniref:response regulator n=1 Tax=unclassified Rhizobium TaxID=2613769 RepID=UPI0016091E65|nr:MULTISPECIES: response regulator [unclassified Rhizobium]MBB3313404.1 CheY-like chemotaxis protein [Rhizobium sp. BK196]MBB3464523.1 CheY-like chemotaxis protein [Rhizobium sp. BK377]